MDSSNPGLWRTGLVLLGQMDVVALPPDTALATLATRFRSGVSARDALVSACDDVRADPPPTNAKQRISFVVQLAALAGEVLRPFAGRWVLDDSKTFGVVYELGDVRVDLFDTAAAFVAEPGGPDALDRQVEALLTSRKRP